MISKVLWALDNEMNDRDFERLCTDLLAREGYHDINPVGFKKDRGRDAEVRIWEGIDSKNKVTFFQFSLNQRWEEKLLNDLESVDRYNHEIDLFVFVTSRTVTGNKQDKLRAFVLDKYGYHLFFYAREWFRHRLEEHHQDLAKKYFNLDLPPTVTHIEILLSTRANTADYFSDVFQDVSAEQTEANLLLKLKNQPHDTQALHALSYVYYSQRHYQDALKAINKALKTKHDNLKNLNLRLAKSIILAEYGIQENSKAILLDAKSMLTEFATKLNRDVDHYNLANVFSALQEYEKAETHYRAALEANPTAAHVWKNLGSLLCHLKKHEEELACYDKAIELRPDLVESYLCKANTLFIHKNDAESAEALFEYAYELNPDLDKRWPHTPYWHALCLCQVGKDIEALEKLSTALEDTPDLSCLLQLKGRLLSELWRQHENLLDEAKKFFEIRIECNDTDHTSLNELIQILEHENAEPEAWGLVERLLNWEPVGLDILRKRADLNLVSIAQGLGYPSLYQKFRNAYGFTDYIVQAHEAGIIPADNIYNVLETLLAIPFTACLESLSMIRNSSESDETDFDRAFQMVLSYCAKYIPALGATWVTNKGCESKDDKVNLISKGAVVLPEIVLIEASRQFGFCLSFHRFDFVNTPEISEELWNSLFADIAANFMFAACDDWGMVEDGKLRNLP